uniref:Uncharacterized protein n=1 Tax=Meloidogyne enterolobii TaxID=390850 RepID=A0A6V7W9J9_MELEN|nr:unnamed protein product [Meloidogyne enterolobii]
MSTSTAKTTEDNFRYVQKVAKSIDDIEKRFVFVYRQILTFEECMEEGPKKNQTVKMLVTWALNEFGGGYKSDKRMLDLWKLMGKYSNTIGMDGVLENVHRLGFFKNVPDFYIMWADHLGAKENKEHFDKMIQICEENCNLSSCETRELFSPLIKKYFPDDCYEEENKTIDFIKMLADDSDNVRPELTLFQKFDYEKSVSSSSSLLPQQPPPSPVVETSAPAVAVKPLDVLKDITTITKEGLPQQVQVKPLKGLGNIPVVTKEVVPPAAVKPLKGLDNIPVVTRELLPPPSPVKPFNFLEDSPDATKEILHPSPPPTISNTPGRKFLDKNIEMSYQDNLQKTDKKSED